MAISRSTTTRAPRAASPVPPAARPSARERATGMPSGPRYDQIIDAMNRLPRPALMILTVALFAYASLDPAGFAARMSALSAVPEPLWWMQGAVVTFYFGAREAHYIRQGKAPAKPQKAAETP